LDFSLDNAVNFIDTADVYSDGESERIIGNALQGNRDKWIIASKVGLHTDEIPSGLSRRKNILERAENSLRRMRTDYIDLYQIHHYDPVTPIEEILDAFEKLITDGKIRYAGCSNYSFEELKCSIKYSHSEGISGYASIQTHYNMFKREAEKQIFPLCEEQQIGVIVYGALGRGVLTDKYINSNIRNSSYKNRSDLSTNVRNDLQLFILKKIKQLNYYSLSNFNSTVQQLVIAWTLRKATVTSLILGTRNEKQMKENLSSLKIRLNKESLREVDNVVGDLDEFRSISLGSIQK